MNTAEHHFASWPGYVPNAPPPSGGRVVSTKTFSVDDMGIRRARHWAEKTLATLSRIGRHKEQIEDVMICANEIITNAATHSDSATPGGAFTVVIVDVGCHGVRVEVIDAGSTSAPHIVDEPDTETGRGLQMVRALSVQWGSFADQAGRNVWCEVPY